MPRLSIIDQVPIPAGATAREAFANAIAIAQLADRLGYARYWMAEHHGMSALASVAPEAAIGTVAAATARIRVGSGAVLLPHYAPLKVAECFRTLHALHPGRIDLGIGRAGGQGGQGSDFRTQLAELLGFLRGSFPPDHPFAKLPVSPAVSGAPDVWLMGTGLSSGALAAELGLPYAFGHFIEPEWTRAALDRYRAAAPQAPSPILAVGVVCADDETEAYRQFACIRLLYRQLGAGLSLPMPTPVQAVAEMGLEPGPLMPEKGEWPHYIVGNPEQVKARLDHMIGALKVEELMIASLVPDHQVRLRTFELLAAMFPTSRRQ